MKSSSHYYKKIVWLELDWRDNTYHDQPVPEEFSQGMFAFGTDCAKAALEENEPVGKGA